MSAKKPKRFHQRVRGAATSYVPFESCLLATREGAPKHVYEQKQVQQRAIRDAEYILVWLQDNLPSTTYTRLTNLMEKEKSK